MQDTSQQVLRDVGGAVVKAAPPIAVWSFTLNDWLAVASMFYVALQAAYLLWKWNADARAREEARRAIAQLGTGPVAAPGQKPPAL
jgi:hypothetical protein